MVSFQINPIWNLTDLKNQREYDETKITELKVSSSVSSVLLLPHCKIILIINLKVYMTMNQSDLS